MPRFSVLAAVGLAAAGCAGLQGQEPRDPHLELAHRVLSSTPLFDGHNDLPWAIRTSESSPGNVEAYGLRGRTSGHTDIPRLREGRVGAQIWSVYIPGSSVQLGARRMQLEQIEIAKQVFALHPDVFQETLTSAEVLPTFRAGRIASVMGMEGGYALENSLDRLREFYDLGVRSMALTHAENTDWADAATALPVHNGLTPFGREIVREMNRVGMLVDLSHAAASTMHATLDVSEAPVIFSHSSARAITDVPRNVPDDVLRRLPENGGVLMITFVPQFISLEVAEWERVPAEARAGRTRPRATIDHVIRHIEHARDVAGIDHVGLGADYDGISDLPVGLNDVSSYPRLFAELARRGWSEDDLRKLAGENLLRVWSQAERVADRLRRERPPSTATIQELDGPRPR